MHGLIRERLEDYLKGAPAKTLPPGFEEHLRACEECREELSDMQEQSRLLHVLAPAESLEPSVGFYARVMERIDAERRPSFWDVFLEPAFSKRVLATSLTLVCLLGGYLAFTEASSSAAGPGQRPEAVMAVQSAGLGSNVERDRATVLVSLATYNRDYR